MINEVIFNELCHGVISELSNNRFKKVIKELVEQGAEGIILGCTEIPLLIKEEDSPVPLFDTTSIHALKAVEFALA
jgi:aspartate racemase